MRAVGALLALASLLAAPIATAADDAWSSEVERLRVFDVLVGLVEDRYWDVDHLDWSAWADAHRPEVRAARTREAFDAALGRMVAALGDDHSVWLGLASGGDPAAARDAPDRLGVRASHVPGAGLVVEHAFATGPLRAAGVRRGDVLAAVDGDALGALEAEGARERLARAVGQGRLLLDVRRGRTAFRADVVVADADVSALAELPDAWMLDARTGYLHVPSFRWADVGERVHRLLHGLTADGATRVVLDLRGNPGGRISQLGLVLGAFMEGPWAEASGRGRIVWTGTYRREGDRGVARLEGPRGTLVAAAVDAPSAFAGPLVVLVDAQSESAGEVAALALQDAGRATVIGLPTGGNVEAVQTFDLPHGNRVAIAVANVRGVEATPFVRGVRPDEVAWSTAADLSRGYDAPVAAALRRLGGLAFTPGKYFHR